MIGPTFARRVFLVAGLYGIVALAPQYFVELGLPHLMERPEHFYGFIGVALAWQVIFLIAASDVMRYRPLMLAGVLEKLSFGAAVAILYSVERVSIGVLTGRHRRPGPRCIVCRGLHCDTAFWARSIASEVIAELSATTRHDPLASIPCKAAAGHSQHLRVRRHHFSTIGMEPTRKSKIDTVCRRRIWICAAARD